MVNLDELKYFYDPHPGIAGALIPIPGSVKRIANSLSGQTMTLREAIEKIQAVTTGKVSVAENFDFISLDIEEGPRKHGFRVIRFRGLNR